MQLAFAWRKKISSQRSSCLLSSRVNVPKDEEDDDFIDPNERPLCADYGLCKGKARLRNISITNQLLVFKF